MSARTLVLYYAWNRAAEVNAPLEVIEDRFPSLFESRRMLYPRLSELADPAHFEQGIGGFIDNILRHNFARFVDHARDEHRCVVREVVRADADGRVTPLDGALLAGADTLIVLGFDSLRTQQSASGAEIEAVRQFLSVPGHLAFVCPHHDVGEAVSKGAVEVEECRFAEFLHHGDGTLPPRQGFGGFARSLLAGLGVPVENRFGLRPRAEADGSPSAIEVDQAQDRHALLHGVEHFNLHPHLPQLERLSEAVDRLDVLARQRIDLAAPPHPFTANGRATFDALLQSRPDAFVGSLLVSDATLWSSTAGGVDALTRLWSNVLSRQTMDEMRDSGG
jgi:hypothetical protein